MTFHEIVVDYMNHQSFVSSFAANHYFVSRQDTMVGLFVISAIPLLLLSSTIYALLFCDTDKSSKKALMYWGFSFLFLSSIVPCLFMSTSIVHSKAWNAQYVSSVRNEYIKNIELCSGNVCSLFLPFNPSLYKDTMYSPVSWRSPSIWADIKHDKEAQAITPLNGNPTNFNEVFNSSIFLPIRVVSATQEGGKTFIFMKAYKSFDDAHRDIDGQVYRTSMAGFINCMSFYNGATKTPPVDKQNLKSSFENSARAQ